MKNMQACLGCDVGAIATKTVVLMDGTVIGFEIARNEGRLVQAIEDSARRALEMAKLTLEEIGSLGGTGWGERYIPFPHLSTSAISALARGVNWAHPRVRTVIDLGGLSATVVVLNEDGRVLEYRTNDRCAAGTGFFIEQAAQALELGVEELCPMALAAPEKARISAQCAVFGESEIVSHLNEGEAVSSIAAGIAYAIASGAATMLNRVGFEPELLVTGGVAKNSSVVKALEEIVGVKVEEIKVDPQELTAVGAALLAREKTGE